MTAATVAPSTDRSSIAPGLRALVGNVAGYSAVRAAQALDRLSGRLGDTVRDVGEAAEDTIQDAVDDHGAAADAVTGGVSAALQDKNPVWGALKEVWAGTRTSTKVLVITALVLALLLGPVVLVLLLLALLVTLIVLAVRHSRG